MWYSNKKLLSYNCLFNFVMSNRGGGKTFSFKEWAIKDFLKNGSQFIYLRRYKSEVADSDKFFNDIIAENKFPEHEFTVKGRTFFIDGKVCGYAVVLSTAMAKKSVSYPNVNKIGFDEFVIKKKSALRYLDDEVITFLEFYETVARLRDNVRVIFMGNNLSLINPYFLFWNIQPDTNKRFNRYGLICVEMFTDEEFINQKRKTRFGQIIEGTPYGDYNMLNIAYEDTEDFLEKKSPNAKFEFNLYFNGEYIGIWLDGKLGKLYASEKYDPNASVTISLSDIDHKPNMFYVKNSNQCYQLAQIKSAFSNGYLWFDNQRVKNVMFQVFRLIGV